MHTGFIILGIMFSLVGFTLVMIAMLTKQKPIAFFNNGLQAEGTITDLGVRQPRPFNKRRFSEPAFTQITIEFLTITGRQVQGDIDTNLGLFYSGQYKLGDKVNVLYNPDNPEEYVTTSSQSTKIARLIMIFTGLFLILTGIGMTLLMSSFKLLINKL
jgi:hypothetical protein